MIAPANTGPMPKDVVIAILGASSVT